MKNQTVAVSGGMGLVGWLVIILAIAKVFGFATLSWWQVLAPLFIAWGLLLALMVLIGVLGLVAYLLK